jgi:hypothetical protein
MAAFNFGDAAATLSIDLPRAGLASGRDYQVTDLWTGAVSSARGALP